MKRLSILVVALLSCLVSNAQLTIYADLGLQGASGTCVVSTIYTDGTVSGTSTIPGSLDNAIESISLTQGYMATLAENPDGSGERFSYMATASTLNVNLAFVLQNKVSFVRVLPLPATPVKKKGAGATQNDERDALNVSWFYDWGVNDVSTATQNYGPMLWGAYPNTIENNLTNVTNKTNVTHFMSFNEPDSKGQSGSSGSSGMMIADNASFAVPFYQQMLRTGHRMVSPATTESQYSVWLQNFTNAAEAANLGIDVVAVHWYDWGNWLNTMNANPNAVDIFNRFRSYIGNVYSRYKKPIWITEFNANVNRPPAVHEAFMNLALPWLESDPRVERYAYFFGNDVPARTTGGALTAAGQIYSNHASVDAYAQNIYDTRPSTAATELVLASWQAASILAGGASNSTFPATYVDPGMNQMPQPALSRGSGVTVPVGSSNGYWGGSAWSTATMASTAVGENKFLTFSLKANSTVSYTCIDKFNIRVAASGPIKYQFEYQIGSGLFVPITTLAVTRPGSGAANFTLGPVNLANIEDLQGVLSTETVTFRITPFEATSSTVAFLIGSGTGDTNPDLSVIGTYSNSNIVQTPPLPLELSDFQSNKIDTKVLLTWKTQTEVNFSHFVLERSTNGTTFYDLGKIDGAKRPEGSKYHYTDHAPDATTTNYYRLKMVDADGTFEYSTILSESFEASDALLAVYPSVSTGNSVEAVFKEVSESAQLKIFNVDGKLMRVYNLPEGSIAQTIPVADFAEGVYFLMLQDRDTVLSRKFIKQ